MSEYDIGKDVARFEEELRRMQMLLEQMYKVMDYNVKKGKIEEPKEGKK